MDTVATERGVVPEGQDHPVPPVVKLVLRNLLQPRRHQHEGRVAVREGPDDPRSPPGLAVDALDPVVRPDPAQRTRSQSLRLSEY